MNLAGFLRNSPVHERVRKTRRSVGRPAMRAGPRRALSRSYDTRALQVVEAGHGELNG